MAGSSLRYDRSRRENSNIRKAKSQKKEQQKRRAVELTIDKEAPQWRDLRFATTGAPQWRDLASL